MAFWISIETPPVSLLVGSAEIVEAGWPPTWLMRAWFCVSVTVAIELSGILATPTGIFERASSEVSWASTWR